MKYISASIFIIVGLLKLFTVEAGSPCPHIFEYVNDENSQHGIVTLKPNGKESKINIKIIFTIKGKLENDYLGDIKLCDVEVKRAISEYNSGNSIKYRVNFPMVSSVPKIKGIYVNNDLLCSGEYDTPQIGTYVTTVTLQHDIYKYKRPLDSMLTAGQLAPPFFTGVHNEYETIDSVYSCTSPSNHNNVLMQVYPVDEKIHGSRTESLKHHASPHDFESSLNGECGKRIDTLLFSNTNLPSDWPWTVSIFGINSRGDGLEFFCLGSLVSDQHLVTTAQCIHDKKPNDIVIKFGAVSLTDWDGEVIHKKLKSAIVHQQFNSKTAEYNIALLTLEKSVQFNNRIRPVCLWGPDNDLDQIIGNTGALVSWDNEDYGGNIQVKRLHIISNVQCRSSEWISSKRMLSEANFCADNRADEWPCSSDSGTSLYLLQHGSWKLRGLISLIPEIDEKPCSTKEYIVFTDVAKFTSWIQSNMQF